MFDDFLVRSLLAGLGVALAAGPLGCFVVWRRMAYFGDATSHAAVLGVAIALAFNLPVLAGVLVMALVMALAIVNLAGRSYSADTILGVASHGALAFGLVAVAFVPSMQLDLMSFLFGDILAVSRGDLGIIWIGAILCISVLIWRWRRILTSTVNAEMAHAMGINPRVEQLIITVGLAIVVAVSIKVVGALLIGAMLIIPAAAARPVVKTPETMAILSVVFGVLAVVAGIGGSFWMDTPAGPSIVSVAAVLFLLTSVFIRQR